MKIKNTIITFTTLYFVTLFSYLVFYSPHVLADCISKQLACANNCMANRNGNFNCINQCTENSMACITAEHDSQGRSKEYNNDDELIDSDDYVDTSPAQNPTYDFPAVDQHYDNSNNYRAESTHKSSVRGDANNCLSVRISPPNKLSHERWYHIKNICGQKVGYGIRWLSKEGKFECENGNVSPGKEAKDWFFAGNSPEVITWGCSNTDLACIPEPCSSN